MSLARACPVVLLLALGACAGLPNLDSMLPPPTSGLGPGAGMENSPFPEDNNVAPPDGYRFSYRVTMRITNDRGTVEPVFYVEPDAAYYARREARDGLTEILVYDTGNDLVVLYADIDGDKRMVHNQMNVETWAAHHGAYRDPPEREVRPLGSRTILGFPTQGYEITTLGGTTELWVTDQAPATLFTAMFDDRTAQSDDAPLNERSMIMEASFTSAHRPEQNYEMEVTQIEPETLVLSTREYASR